MTSRSAEEVLVDDKRVLGDEYGTGFYHCCQELWRLSAAWDRYESLFGSNERVTLLNETSPTFWHFIQGALHETVLLGLCRLTDPPSTGKRQNLSVQRLFFLDPTDDKGDLKVRVDRAVERASFARTWRDKRIAHNDLDQTTGTADLLEPSTGERISGAIVAVHDVLRWVRARYFDSQMYLMDLGDHDTRVMLMSLARGRYLREREREELDAGNIEGILRPAYTTLQDDYGSKRRYAKQDEFELPPAYRGELPFGS